MSISLSAIDAVLGLICLAANFSIFMRRNAVETSNSDEFENEAVSSIGTNALVRSPLNTSREPVHFNLNEDLSFWMDHYVQILLRKSPLNDMELSSYYKSCVKQESAHCLSFGAHPETRFTFAHVACETIGQETLLRMIGTSMVENCLPGYNSCIFTYGQDSKTMIIANVSPSICFSTEVLNTLKFAQRANLIQNNAVVNEDASVDVMALQHEFQLLEVCQREQDNKCTEMILKFRENEINRMDSLFGRSVPADSYLLEENNMHTKEVQMLCYRNPEVARLALENIRLREQLRRFQDIWDGEREMLLTEVSELRDQLALFLDENSKQDDCMQIEAVHDKKEKSSLQLELERSQEELEKCRHNLKSCLETNKKLCKEIADLNALLDNQKSVMHDLGDGIEVIKAVVNEDASGDVMALHYKAVVNEDASGDVMALQHQIQLLKEEVAVLKRQNVSRSLTFSPKVIEEAREEHKNDYDNMPGGENKIPTVSSKQMIVTEQDKSSVIGKLMDLKAVPHPIYRQKKVFSEKYLQKSASIGSCERKSRKIRHRSQPDFNKQSRNDYSFDGMDNSKPNGKRVDCAETAVLRPNLGIGWEYKKQLLERSKRSKVCEDNQDIWSSKRVCNVGVQWGILS